MGKCSPTKLNGDCEEVANPSTAYGRRLRNWIDAHGSVPHGQVVAASCGNKRCIALRHAYVRPRVEQPRKYRKIADRVHRLKVGQHFKVPGVGTDERSRNRFRSGLYAAARLDSVSVRGQPDGGVLLGDQIEKFLPTNLPTGTGSYSPFQRLAAPVENVSRR